MPRKVAGFLPVLVVLVGLVLLMYPLALLFGLPLALRDMRDLRKWDKATVTAVPPQNLEDTLALTFAAAVKDGVLVQDGRPLDAAYTQTDERVTLAAEPKSPLVTWGETLTPVSKTLYRYPGNLPDPLTLYVGDTLAVGGAVPAAETPDDVRTMFTFGNASGPVLLDDAVLAEGTDYTVQGDTVTVTEAPSFGSVLRRASGDYAVLDDGTVVFTAPLTGEVRAVKRVVRLAERLAGEANGTNRTFTFARTPVVETEPYDVYVDDTLLSSDDERPDERVDGEQATFTFDSSEGIVTIDGAPQAEGDYTRDGPVITFAKPPARNAQLRQYPGAFLSDSETGEVLLAQAPLAGATVWTDAYTVYSRPGCGANVMACFFALPQHPVPFPNWIAARIVPFFGKFPLADERNIFRAVLYTAAGTLAALALGAAVGTLLAVLFVMVRPLERALLPWLVASQTVPIIALVPVLLLILGNAGITIQTSLLPTALIGAYIAFFPVVVGTVKGLRSVDPLALDLMKSYAATPVQLFAKVRFPAAVPFLFTSLKLAAAAALVGALVAETESNNRRGLGFQILGQVQSGNVADVWILLLISGLLGIGLVGLVSLLQRVLAPWERS